MRSITPVIPLLLIAALAHAEVPAVTTAPSAAETTELRAEVRRLAAENEMLRAQLAAISVASPIAAASLPTPSPDEKPIAGVEGILQGIPREQIPGPDDAAGGLRDTLLTKWVQDHANGKMITLHGRFADASGLSGNHFVVRMGTGASRQVPHPFEATVVMPSTDASTVLQFRKSAPIQVTGRVKNAAVTRSSEGTYVVLLDSDLAIISGEGSRYR